MAGGLTGTNAPLRTVGTPVANTTSAPADADPGTDYVLPLPGPDVPATDPVGEQPPDDVVDPPTTDPVPVPVPVPVPDPVPIPQPDPEPVPEPVPTPDPTPDPAPTPAPTPGPDLPHPTPDADQGSAPVQPRPTPISTTTPGSTPVGNGVPRVTPDSLDAASAARSARPVPPGAPTLADTPVTDADRLSTDEILARSNAGIQAAAGAGAGGATTDTGSGAAIAGQLERNLHKDAQGRTIFDRKIESLEVERQRVLAELQGGGDSTELINRLLSITAQQELLYREKEKNTELLRLVVSLMMGNVPTGLVERLCALGLRDVVSRVISDTVGNGRMLGREAIRALHSLGSMGISVSVAPEHQTEDTYREQDRERRRQAATAVDGGQAAALWVRARRTGEEDDSTTPTPARPSWGPRTSPLTGGAPAFVRWNAASAGDSSADRA